MTSKTDPRFTYVAVVSNEPPTNELSTLTADLRDDGKLIFGKPIPDSPSEQTAPPEPQPHVDRAFLESHGTVTISVNDGGVVSRKG
jgi:hypothetical protein